MTHVFVKIMSKRVPKNGKNVPKIANIGNYWHCFLPFWTLSSHIVNMKICLCCRGSSMLRFGVSFVKIG